MQKITWMLFFISITTLSQDLVLTGIMDGPLEGGTPKIIQLYAKEEIPDLSLYGLGSTTNGNGKSSMEFVLSGSAVAGQYLYVSREQAGFEAFFGFSPDFIDSVAIINGDDAIELFYQPTEDAIPAVYDTYGDIHTDGTGEPWEYTNGWAHRTITDLQEVSVFDSNQWVFSGKNELVGATTNATAKTPFPIEDIERTLTIATNLLKENSFTLSPNPTKNGLVHISISNKKEPMTVTIYNSIGKNLGTQKTVGDTIDLAYLTKGVYLLKFETNNKTMLRKIVKN